MNKFSTLELFAGAGGMALGMELAGFNHLFLNDFDQSACNTLKINRPQWNISCGDIRTTSFEEYHNIVDLVTGGFPCQAFSYSGKRLGFEDTRGTLFYEFARCVQEVKPKVFLAENVKGLLKHDNGRTLDTILTTFRELGYYVYNPNLVNANNYGVAQKRERIIIVGVRIDLKDKILWSIPEFTTSPVLKDIFFKGKYYNQDVSNITSPDIQSIEYQVKLY